MPDTTLLNEVKAYMRVDGTLEDNTIAGLIEAAMEYIQEASGKKYLAATGEPLINSSLAKLALKQLVAHWYDHRGVQHLGKPSATEVSYSFATILAHITTSREFI